MDYAVPISNRPIRETVGAADTDAKSQFTPSTFSSVTPMITSMNIVHRVQKSDMLDKSDCDFREGLVFPPEAETMHPKGVSFFIPHEAMSEAIHDSFYVPRKFRCKVCDLEKLPPCLKFTYSHTAGN
jgi:hypothetical protein